MEKKKSDIVATQFVEVLRKGLGENPTLDLDRQIRLLAYVRLRKSAELVEVATELLKHWVGREVPAPEDPLALQRKGVVMHCLEILLRNDVLKADVPAVPEKNKIDIDKNTGVCLVLVQPGEFWMESAMGENDDDKRPQKRVKISEGFWMGKYPVTNLEYRRFIEKKTGARAPDYWKDKRFNLWDHPVVGVSWNDLLASNGYLKWSKMSLPNEAQWEYACRAVSEWDHSFPGGKEELKYHAWHGEELSGDKAGSTHGVGLLRPNGGLFDLQGNIWEWCQDVFDANAYGKRRDGWEAQVWTLFDAGDNVEIWGSGAGRVVRGGSWGNGARDCRATDRYGRGPGCRYNDLGFRLAASSLPGR